MAEPVRLLLIAGYLGAVATGAYVLQDAPDIPQAPSTQNAQPLPALEIPPAAINSLAAYEAITERPLFTASRRPPADDETPADAAKTKLPDRAPTIDGLRLSAVLRGPDSLTILVEDQSGQTRTLHQGDRLGTWEVDQILDDRVVIVSGAQRKTLLVHQFDLLPARPKAKRPTRRITQRQRPRLPRSRTNPIRRNPAQLPEPSKPPKQPDPGTPPEERTP